MKREWWRVLLAAVLVPCVMLTVSCDDDDDDDAPPAPPTPGGEQEQTQQQDQGADLEDPQLLGPADGASMAAGLIQFTWGDVDDADEYRIEVREEDGDVVETETSEDSVENINLPAGKYKWRVWARDNGRDGDKSEYRTLELT